MTIEISADSYGFSHNWTLSAFGKKFFLGQDVKFCRRVLGMEPSYIASKIGTNDLRTEEGKTALAQFIINELELDEGVVNNLESWALCAQ